MLKKILLGVAITIAVAFLLSKSIQRPDYYVNSFSHLSYPEDRGNVKFESILIEKNNSYTIEKIYYDSKGQKIYGLLYLPISKDKSPALVYLPAARAKKEALSSVMEGLAKQGYAILAIDQRGIGETAGIVPSIEDDYREYGRGNEPVSFMMVYDALRAFDFLSQNKYIDNGKIAFTGESMGARTAIIAAAIEKRSRGAIVFSTSGFNSGHPFISIIDPNNYVQLISPRKFILFHSKSDSVIPFGIANNTFTLAKEPKELVIMPSPCDHGWCNSVKDVYYEKLDWLMK